jgi:hypothetical protein
MGVSLLYFIACICSLNHVPNERPVLPIYCRGQFLHFRLYTTLPLYLHVFLYGSGSFKWYFYVGM